MSGIYSYYKGIKAEKTVEDCYVSNGHSVCARRWRSRQGEIDIIIQKENVFIFVEVKSANTHKIAVERLTQRQIRRIWASADEFISIQPYNSALECRFDVALVDACGRIKIIESAIAA